jgi:hypothetical protein
MNKTWKRCLWQHFGGAIDLFEQVAINWTEPSGEKQLWDERGLPEGSTAFWNISYHSLIGLICIYPVQSRVLSHLIHLIWMNSKLEKSQGYLPGVRYRIIWHMDGNNVR